MFFIPVTYINNLSKPKPKPEWGAQLVGCRPVIGAIPLGFPVAPWQLVQVELLASPFHAGEAVFPPVKLPWQ